ncbi:hypothetical protein [Dolichospermum planctonicum]|uniref:Uncharacterized protein n=1 Tax=Dolichospermum planctonicum TaxID=136072 RepID=A0A480A8B6_9CYAN|nr:hypothetical protein [Dolichospermum planctonicum]GCL41315.1 hypothetical protein NIES80_10100 [Dolichospermum planctonicum]
MGTPENSLIIKPIVEAIAPRLADLFDVEFLNSLRMQSFFVDCTKAFISAQSEMVRVVEENETQRAKISSDRDIRLAEIEKDRLRNEQEHERFMCGRKEAINQIIELADDARSRGNDDSSRLYSQQLTAILLDNKFNK